MVLETFLLGFFLLSSFSILSLPSGLHAGSIFAIAPCGPAQGSHSFLKSVIEARETILVLHLLSASSKTTIGQHV